MMSTLAYTRAGRGEPLVLLHGLGSWRKAWDPVIPLLADRFDVIAVDLPGFGGSPPLAQAVLSPSELAAAVAGLVGELGVTAPHLAGNSLGGWVALEFARISSPASVTLLSPAGLWPGRIPLYDLVSLRATRWLCEHAGGLLYMLAGCRVGRMVMLGQTHGRPMRMSPGRARASIRAMATCPGFDAAMRGTTRGPFLAGQAISAPVTVAFGSRDLLLLRGSRRLDQLPADVRLGSLPGCGHIPMADDPEAVAALITAGASRHADGGPAAVHGRSLGHHPGTAFLYCSYSGPNLRASAGCSYHVANAHISAPTSTA
jgi:pimeloyl-ACP methyl ester carboxylesterase